MKCDDCQDLESHLPVYLADPANRDRVRVMLDGFRERTSVKRVKILRKGGEWRPCDFLILSDVKRAIAEYTDALIWGTIQDALEQDLKEMRDLRNLRIPRGESGDRIRAARDEALVALRSRTGWSCEADDLDLEAEARYLEATGQL